MAHGVTLRQLEKKVVKLEKKMIEVREILNLLPPICDPTTWKELQQRDEDTLRFMILESKGDRNRLFSTSEIAKSIGLNDPYGTGRVQVWRSLRKIKKLQRKHHKTVLLEDKEHKRWRLNWADFEFRIPEV